MKKNKKTYSETRVWPQYNDNNDNHVDNVRNNKRIKTDKRVVRLLSADDSATVVLRIRPRYSRSGIYCYFIHTLLSYFMIIIMIIFVVGFPKVATTR